jgi:hypothetical protein
MEAHSGFEIGLMTDWQSNPEHGYSASTGWKRRSNARTRYRG